MNLIAQQKITSHYQLKLKLDIAPLKKALLQHDSLFGQYPQRGEAATSPHREMTDIWVRYNDIKPFLASGDFSEFGFEHDSVWYDCVEKIPQVKNLVFQIMSAVQGERLGGVLITKLPPGGEIKPHSDEGWHAAYYDKYYIPIQNKKGAAFYFHDGVIKPEEGDVYWFDNSNLHWVKNETDSERIAMIVCIKTNNRKGL